MFHDNQRSFILGDVNLVEKKVIRVCSMGEEWNSTTHDLHGEGLTLKDFFGTD